jgi:hypothetical protein
MIGNAVAVTVLAGVLACVFVLWQCCRGTKKHNTGRRTSVANAPQVNPSPREVLKQQQLLAGHFSTQAQQLKVNLQFPDKIPEITIAVDMVSGLTY